ncbi:hypothetical protein SELMODRAFT_429956 [Selaginella moellendorffii]|uniref:DUF1995 domain-containing protein n=1 Tax=Selaginella moellendorffii TaxID=88036 RepID=D8T7W0_SELML|nr:uncharacterized protein LOC9632915 isoform X2 [Selaginella moellendorffii]EFJ07225.1 hypothetical protein SELMODRAFT_429956 [Selaginella moellendorffii]|eukprot:XP_002991654.1 uncharacterized protein LOC9632915 isoform X2 [Selaginella moellendorffii]
MAVFSAFLPIPPLCSRRRSCQIFRERRHGAARASKNSCIVGALVIDGPCANPQTLEDSIDQAREAIQRAVDDGKKTQQLELLLPVNQREFNFLDTEPRDYPCGVGEEFQACSKMVTAIFRGMQEGGQALDSRRIGEVENEMDPVGLIYPSSKTIAAVVFPIAETLNQIRSLVKSDPTRPLLLVNPQWKASGQVVSDFGFGPWKRKAEEFLENFERVYSLIEQRIGEASNVTSSSTGGVVRLLKCYSYDWHVYLMSWDGNSELLGKFPNQPTYKELESLVSQARKAMPWKAPPRMLGGSEPAPPPLPKSLSAPLTADEIDAMEAAAVRRALIALGQPSSGRISTLRERLKEAQLQRPSA